jgi:hypothetical protein
MQALLAGFANVALKYTHTCARLAAPAVSEYLSAKVWVVADPEFGVTETAEAFVTVKDQIGELSVPDELFATTIQ